MGGSVAPLAAMGGIAAAVVVPVAVGAGVANEYINSQQHGMGEPTPELTANPRFVLVVHNWVTVEFREFATYDAARAAFDAGLNLRRFLVRVHKADEPDRDDGHGRMWPWHELRPRRLGFVARQRHARGAACAHRCVDGPHFATCAPTQRPCLRLGQCCSL